MFVKYHQIFLKETFAGCQDSFFDDIPSFFQLLEEHFDISGFILSVFIMPSTSPSDVSGSIPLLASSLR